MRHSAAQHGGTVPEAVNRVPSLSLEGVRRAGTLCPCLLDAASDYAARFYPKAGSLVRAVWG